MQKTFHIKVYLPNMKLMLHLLQVLSQISQIETAVKIINAIQFCNFCLSYLLFAVQFKQQNKKKLYNY